MDIAVVPNYSIAVDGSGVHANRNEILFLEELCGTVRKCGYCDFC